jgi:hypothetical protein
LEGLNHPFVVWLLVLSGLLALASCQEKKAQNVLSHAEMVRVMTEIYVAEDKVNRLSLEPDSSRKIFDIMRKHIESRTGIPDSVFQRSLDYYQARPLEMDKIYTALVDSLNLKERRTPASKPE